MSGKPGLLAQIAEDVVDESVPLAVLLRKCLMLGAQVGSERLREWATRELNGYVGAPRLPDYRRIPAAMELRITNMAGYNAITQRLQPSVLPEKIFGDVDIESATMSNGIGELEAMVASGEKEHKLSPHRATVIVDYLNKFHTDDTSVVAAAYWVIYPTSIHGLLSRVRTMLVELISELVAQTPHEQAAPDKATTDRAVQVLVYGDHNTVSLQHTGDGGTNTAHTASGTGATAIGNQSADGDNATVIGSQAVRGDHNTVAGRNNPATHQTAKESWWTGTRKRGVLITVATLIAAVVAVFTWLGWNPWS